MLTSQDLQKKVQSDSEILARLKSLERSVAIMHGDVLQMLRATPKQQTDNSALDHLIRVAAQAMNKPGVAVSWLVVGLLGRCLDSDSLAHDLTTAINALPCTHTAKGVGKYLGYKVKEKYTTPDGLTLWREYNPGDPSIWSIKGFETRKVGPKLF